MPSPANTAELLDLISRSGVADERRVSQFIESLRQSSQLPHDPVRLAEALVNEGLLTRFQAEQLLQGKWKRFNIGKYKVLERLGSGGMGSVYLCEHTLMRRHVAVKVLPAAKAEDPAALERFYREARAVAALDHPNIVRAYDIDQDEKLHFLVMEHVDGASLQEIIKRGGPLDVTRACHYMRQAALGLQHAHEQAALVHRDIKPGNILVDRNGIVKILDMGLARFFHDEEDVLTRKYDENVLGTADYLAPEQALDSHTVDIRADIYSLGATFYFTLTGKPPFADGSVAQKLMWHQTRQPRSIRLQRPEVPEAVCAIIEKMMAKDPDQRYRTPMEVVEALAPWTQTPIDPPPEKEMPQLSRAAMPADTSMTRQGPVSTNASPAPRRQWQVTGGSGSGRGGTVTTPQHTPQPTTPPPVVPSARRATSEPSPGSTPQQRATVPPSSGQVTSPQPPVSRPAPVPRPVVTAPQPITPAPIPQATSQTTTASPVEETPWVDVPTETTFDSPSQSRSRRRNRDEHASFFWLWVVFGIGLLCSVIGGVVYLITAKPVGTNPVQQPQRVALVVDPAGTDGSTFRTVYSALGKAKPGDRILLRGETNEAFSPITGVEGITLEAEEGKTFTWKAPTKWVNNPRVKTMVGIRKYTNVTFRNILFDGANSADVLVELFNRCPGLKFENCTFRNYKKYGIAIMNVEGDLPNPIVFSNINLNPGNPNTVGIHLDITPNPGYPQQNRYITFRNIKMEGPGTLMACPSPEMLGEIDLPAGLSISTEK